MLFQETSSGNAASEEMYGIFDPEEGSLILKATDWLKGNRKEVEQLIGYPPPFYDDKVFFCCYGINLKKKK